jgi:hypothetical protein
MAKMNLGIPHEETPRAAACPWKLCALLSVAAVVIALGFWLPAPLFQLVQQTAQIIGGTP